MSLLNILKILLLLLSLKQCFAFFFYSFEIYCFFRDYSILLCIFKKLKKFKIFKFAVKLLNKDNTFWGAMTNYI